jgi:DNA helicase-2/ATP-dependent DNA helicase PcrA
MNTYRQKLEQKFHDEYQKLNPQQRSAVDNIEGPVMVIAGPGTGKTQILAARIGKILLDTDAQPENILCLTYTDAGAIAMRRRLLGFIGPDAYRVPIYTFHAFCNDVIQDNLSAFQKNMLTPISELETIELFKKLIDTLPKNHLLKRYRGDEYYEISNLRSLFSSMKREGWTPAFLNQCIDEYILSLPQREGFIYKKNGKGYQKGDLKVSLIAEETERMEKLRAAVDEFERYRQLMMEWKRYDFDDMITWVIAAFENNSNLLANYQERYQYVLVDEYQDTSGSQNRLVSLLINYWEKPNIFVVGDDDQSIFRFQGANVENMLELQRQFLNDVHTVVLTHNYRSSQPILDASKSVIDRNEERLVSKLKGLSKELRASGEKVMHLSDKPLIKKYHSARDEMAGITERIANLIAEGVEPGKIAVIYRENRYGLELSRYLQLSNIPIYSRKSINLLDEPFAKKIFCLLDYISMELDIPYSGDGLLFQILHYELFDIQPIEIAKLTVEAGYRSNGSSIRKVLFDKFNRQSMELFEKEEDKNLVAASAMVETLISEASNLPLQLFFEKLIIKGGFLAYVLKNDRKHFLMQVLTSLFDFIKDETSRNPSLNLKELVEMIDLMRKQKISIPLMQVTGHESGVNLLTAHGAKGLEFSYVFVSGSIAGFWEKKNAGSGGYKLPDNIFSETSAHSDVEEQRRLFYVALTRAEKHLEISYYQFDNAGKEVEPSRFIAELIESAGLIAENIEIDEAHRFRFSLLQFNDQMPEIENIEEDFIGPILEKFVMNVTALNNYLDCPLNFYYNSLLRIPSAKGEAAVFGSAVHHALEQLFRRMIEQKEKGNNAEFPDEDFLMEEFRKYMFNNRESFSTESYKRRLEYGDEIIRNYYRRNLNTWNKIALVELSVRGVQVDGVPLKGKLDKIEFNGKEVNVVDYKTGDPEKGRLKAKGPSDKEPNGGSYWRQAVFYKLLLDNFRQKEWKVVSTEFDFIEPDKRKEFVKQYVPISDADTLTLRQQIKMVWDKIQARDFYTGCGKKECHWCNFVKENKLAVTLHELKEEES